MSAKMLASCALALAGALASAESRDFMSDSLFMDPIWHMKVEAAKSAPQQVEVTTTGGRFRVDGARDEIRCWQRIPGVREVLRIKLPAGALARPSILAQTAGAVIIESEGGVGAKIGCDSLLMLRSDKPMDATCQVLLDPAQVYSTGPNHLIMDPRGAVGLYPIDAVRGPQADDPATPLTYPLDAPGMLWVSVGPPRPYEWEKSLKDVIIWHWSAVNAYPSNEDIERWSKYGNVLLMQSEVMAWTSFHVEFEPRSRAELERVLDKCHALGMRAIVYTSPFYFIKGTPLQGKEIANAPNFEAGCLGDLYTMDGANVDLFLAEITKVVNDLGVDGLYFDGIYPGSVKNTYYVMRKSRELLGDDRILEIHATLSAPAAGWGNWLYVPTSDTYADFTLKGETFGFVSPEWLRYFVSGYNISNAIGVVCNNSGYQIPTEQQIKDTLAANARLSFVPCGGEAWNQHVHAMGSWYFPRLNDALRQEIEKAN